MKKPFIVALVLLLITSCNSKTTSSEAEKIITEIEVQKSGDSMMQSSWEKMREKGEQKAKQSGVKIIKTEVSENSIGTPEATLTFKNNTGKTIDGIRVQIYCYNNFDEPIESGIMEGNMLRGIMQSAIKPGNTSSTTWTLNSFELTTKIKPVITEIHFTDGSAWGKE